MRQPSINSLSTIKLQRITHQDYSADQEQPTRLPNAGRRTKAQRQRIILQAAYTSVVGTYHYANQTRTHPGASNIGERKHVSREKQCALPPVNWRLLSHPKVSTRGAPSTATGVQRRAETPLY